MNRSSEYGISNRYLRARSWSSSLIALIAHRKSISSEKLFGGRVPRVVSSKRGGVPRVRRVGVSEGQGDSSTLYRTRRNSTLMRGGVPGVFLKSSHGVFKVPSTCSPILLAVD